MEILALCRAGFEKEVAAELTDVAAHYGVGGYAKTRENSGYVVFVCTAPEQALALIEQVPFQELVFVRHWLLTEQTLDLTGCTDRVKPLQQSLDTAMRALGIETIAAVDALCLDTNEGKALTKLTRGVAYHLQRAVAPLLRKKAAFTAQILFLDGQTAVAGLYLTRNCAPWLGGIPRLRLPRQAPSRATLKLEEAWHHFIPATEWDTRLAGGMRAVDLGAAPGGWTWQLVQRSMFVDAVDNGPMDASLMESGQVRHHRLDGFGYRPAKPVDWLVCDIADKPARVASMIAQWGGARWCREAVFNLKLPMKQRYSEVKKCESRIAEVLLENQVSFKLRFKQLYHDREEVTGHLQLF